ncbi:hypothetical protein GCM10022397_40000 [Flavivirga jejuensis]
MIIEITRILVGIILVIMFYCAVIEPNSRNEKNRNYKEYIIGNQLSEKQNMKNKKSVDYLFIMMISLQIVLMLIILRLLVL